MTGKFKYTTLGLILIICQILLSEYVNIWPVLYIAIFPQLIILLPPTTNKTAQMVAALVLGFCVDIFADGVLGLNAAAMVAMAYLRPFVLKVTLSKTSLDSSENQPLLPRNVELQKLALITAILLAVFFSVYIVIDSAGTFPLWYILLKTIICVAANTIISLMCSIALFERFLR